MIKPEKAIIGRRNFLKATATLPVIGAYAYTSAMASPLKVGFIGTGNQGKILLKSASPAYLNVVAMADLRPDHRVMGAAVIRNRYNPDVRVYSDYTKMLADGGFEAVIVATPLWTHAPISIDCMNAGYHVLCEKTMAYDASQCEAMIRTARQTNRILAVGHQRHANPLYLQAKQMVESGKIGDVYHIRSLWHRNNDWRNEPHWFDEDIKNELGNPVDYVRSKFPDMTKEQFQSMPSQEQFELYFEWMTTVDPEFNVQKYGYDTADQMGNWRLHSKYSKGLMSELGSHQIDVCNWIWGSQPEYVTGTGGLFHYKDGRDVEDHVFAVFRYPNNKVMTFSSITTNDLDHYYDQIMGTKGTIYLTGESEAMFFMDEKAENTAEVSVAQGSAGAPVADTTYTWKKEMSSQDGDTINPMEAYGQEIRMFANAVRNNDPSLVCCDGMGGYKSAIAVFKANEAFATRTIQECLIPENIV